MREQFERERTEFKDYDPEEYGRDPNVMTTEEEEKIIR